MVTDVFDGRRKIRRASARRPAVCRPTVGRGQPQVVHNIQTETQTVPMAAKLMAAAVVPAAGALSTTPIHRAGWMLKTGQGLFARYAFPVLYVW